MTTPPLNPAQPAVEQRVDTNLPSIRYSPVLAGARSASASPRTAAGSAGSLPAAASNVGISCPTLREAQSANNAAVPRIEANVSSQHTRAKPVPKPNNAYQPSKPSFSLAVCTPYTAVGLDSRCNISSAPFVRSCTLWLMTDIRFCHNIERTNRSLGDLSTSPEWRTGGLGYARRKMT